MLLRRRRMLTKLLRLRLLRLLVLRLLVLRRWQMPDARAIICLRPGMLGIGVINLALRNQAHEAPTLLLLVLARRLLCQQLLLVRLPDYACIAHIMWHLCSGANALAIRLLADDLLLPLRLWRLLRDLQRGLRLLLQLHLPLRLLLLRMLRLLACLRRMVMLLLRHLTRHGHFADLLNHICRHPCIMATNILAGLVHMCLLLLLQGLLRLLLLLLRLMRLMLQLLLRMLSLQLRLQWL
mmetsp:Transcript_131490/g.380342  ORF Transcript_131490/g.380342 Transcript_131490/m.380342 type:complete len:238 (+) Transcript_131490:419-1132(+)